MIESCKKKKCKRTVQSFLRLKKNLTIFFAIYMYLHRYISLHIYIYLYTDIYLYISIYIYIYVLIKKNATFCVLFQKIETFSRSFTFFAKEWNVLCVLLRSLQKNFAFFVFFYVLKKWTQKNASFFWVS